MRLKELLDTANEGYSGGDGGILTLTEYYTKRGTVKYRARGGDTLAKFVVVEIAETYDEGCTTEEQFREAIRVMEAAERDIGDVVAALCEAQTEAMKQEVKG